MKMKRLKKFNLVLLGPLFLLIVLGSLRAIGQKDSTGSGKFKLNHLSIAFSNNHTAFPFASFSKLVSGAWHPGFELGTGFDWSQHKKHDWYQEFKLGYFNHQFIQHGITLYTNFGYKYKFSKHWTGQAGLGAGLLFSHTMVRGSRPISQSPHLFLLSDVFQRG